MLPVNHIYQARLAIIQKLEAYVQSGPANEKEERRALTQRLLCDTALKFENGAITVQGDLNLDRFQVTQLPADLKRITGNCSMQFTTIRSLPNQFHVDGHLRLMHTPLQTLPAGMRVGGDLEIQYAMVPSLPGDLEVGGSLDMI